MKPKIVSLSELYPLPLEADDIFVAVSPIRKQIATALLNSNVRFWDLEDKNFNLKEIKHNAISISLSADGKQLATADKNGRVGLLNLETNNFIPLSKISGNIKIVSLSADSKKLAIVDQDNSVGLFDLKREVFTPLPKNNSTENLEDKSAQVSIKFSSDSNQLAIESLLRYRETQLKKQVSVWDLNTNEVKPIKVGTWEDFIFNANSQLQLLISGSQSEPGSEEIALLTDSNRNQLTNFRQTECQLKYDPEAISIIGTSSNTNLIASGDDDTVCLKDLQGNELAKFKMPNQRKIKNISFSGDGSLMAILLDDGSIRLWQIGDLDYLLSKGCNWVQDYLKNDSKLENSDRTLCDGVPKSKQVVSQNSTTFTSEDFSPALKAIAEDYYTRGKEQADSEYIENFPNIIAKSATNAEKADAYVNRGVIYFRQKEYDLAIDDYTEAIALAPQHIHAYINRGIAYSSLGKHKRAIEDYYQALAIDDQNADAYISKGIAYSCQGNHEQAIEDYDQAISLAPKNADAYYAKAFTQTLIKGKKQEAIENYWQAADFYKQQNKPKYYDNVLKNIKKLSTSESP